jgi:hypothetical protein
MTAPPSVLAKVTSMQPALRGDALSNPTTITATTAASSVATVASSATRERLVQRSGSESRRCCPTITIGRF